MAGRRPKRNTSSTLHLPYRSDRRTSSSRSRRHYDEDETMAKINKRKVKYNDFHDHDDHDDEEEYEDDEDQYDQYELEEEEEDNNNRVPGTDIAFGVGGVLVEVFDLFLTCMGSEDLRDDKEVLDFIGMNSMSIRARRTCFINKEMEEVAMMPPDMDVADIDDKLPSSSTPTSNKTTADEERKMKTAKLKKWIQKKKAYMKRQHQQQVVTKEKVWNILEESIHRRTTFTPSSRLNDSMTMSESSNQRLPHPYPLSTSGKKQITVSSQNDANMYSIREEETTSTRDDMSEAERDDFNHRDDVDTTEYGTNSRNTTIRTGPAASDDDRDDDDDDYERREAAATDRTTTYERRQQSDERQSSKQHIIDEPELVKPSMIAKKDDKKKWLSSVQFPVKRFASFKAEKSNRKKQTTTTNHLDEPMISTKWPKRYKVVSSANGKLVINSGRISPDSHHDEPTMSTRPESSKIVVHGVRKSSDANEVRMDRLSATEEARESYQRRLDLLARSAAVRAAAAASRCDE